jgi:protein SCO1/2
MKYVYAITLSLLLAVPAFAGDASWFKGQVQSEPAPQGLPKNVRNVDIDQHLNQQVTLSLPMRDEDGHGVTLGDYFGKRPVILVMAYYECPNLCTMVMNGVFSAMKPLPFVAGQDFEVVSVSFNPHDTPELAKQKKQSYLTGYHQTDQASGFHFLTADEPAIEQLCREVGFRYSYDSVTKQYSHASGIMMLTPDGKLSRYFYGVDFAPSDMKYGLMDASSGKIGSVTDKVLLFCSHYDPTTGKYGAAISTLLKIGGSLTLLVMGGMFFAFHRSNKLKAQASLAMSIHTGNPLHKTSC